MSSGRSSAIWETTSTTWTSLTPGGARSPPRERRGNRRRFRARRRISCVGWRGCGTSSNSMPSRRSWIGACRTQPTGMASASISARSRAPTAAPTTPPTTPPTTAPMSARAPAPDPGPPSTSQPLPPPIRPLPPLPRSIAFLLLVGRSRKLLSPRRIGGDWAMPFFAPESKWSATQNNERRLSRLRRPSRRHLLLLRPPMARDAASAGFHWRQGRSAPSARGGRGVEQPARRVQGAMNQVATADRVRLMERVFSPTAGFSISIGAAEFHVAADLTEPIAVTTRIAAAAVAAVVVVVVVVAVAAVAAVVRAEVWAMVAVTAAVALVAAADTSTPKNALAGIAAAPAMQLWARRTLVWLTTSRVRSVRQSAHVAATRRGAGFRMRKRPRWPTKLTSSPLTAKKLRMSRSLARRRLARLKVWMGRSCQVRATLLIRSMTSAARDRATGGRGSSCSR